MYEAFALSYIENSLISNPVLAPPTLRDLNDLYLLVDKAMGKSISTNALSYPYSDAEINEITSIINKLIKLRDILLKVNQLDIASTAQSDQYRIEPSVLDDHDLGEAQLLTIGAEENLLKFAELRGTLTEKGQVRWQQIKKTLCVIKH